MADEAKKSPYKMIKDVIFFYSSVTRPQKQLNPENKPPASDHNLEFHSYEIKVLITEKMYKAMKKAFAGAKNFPHSKEWDVDKCVAAGVDTDEDMVLVKFAQPCLNGSGAKRKESRQIPLIGIAGKVQDRNGVSVDSETRIGNGSKGHLQFNPYESNFGLYLYPVAVCITELVEVDEAAAADFDAFGLEELEEVEGFEEQVEEEEEEMDPFSDGPGF